jgi:hypothetical protein
MTKFMESLEREDRRSLVVDLLSSVSRDPGGESHLRQLSVCNLPHSSNLVRRSISLSIATNMFEEASTSLPEGHAHLLGRLVLDGALRLAIDEFVPALNLLTLAGRLQDQATDFMMLLVAHTFVSTNPDHKQKQYRDEILTALWCRYGSKSLQSRSELAEWFTYALFGRHATQHEVKVWNKRCKSWLGDETSTKDGTGVSEEKRSRDEKTTDSPI